MAEEYPNLDHWKHVEEFMVYEAALLMAQIDPYDYPDGIEQLKEWDHPRWKTAKGYQRAIATAIARGVLTASHIHVIETNYDGQSYIAKFDESRHTWADIDTSGSTITRQSLFGWIRKQNIILILPPHKRQKDGEFIKAVTLASDGIIEVSVKETPKIAYAPYLDENNNLSPIELRATTAAWEAVTGNGDPLITGKAVKPALRKWLTEHAAEYGGLGKEAIERCATVANWNKNGGAPKTPTRTPPRD
ncbi:hypothetical protein LSG25_11735 [Paralcaligenes sp. KSB-10]|uniref:hypothetical protein n=1 Tax=Paralcaligenes sp. KSB-10 TaxID=2901142 RepID=UPI001E2D7621|nr:hypothetical protein [Paralcaligenes sp. KSB-10]UHL62755.1 hypothetical protein LSG25_11735 [Paralcaligenes sp. KSB-10]